jgi:hypothetical protein
MNYERQLEEIVDSQGLAATLNRLARVCHGKAQHIVENWQDGATTRQWAQLAGRLETAADAASKKGI